jgi:hypothetical protein
MQLNQAAADQLLVWELIEDTGQRVGFEEDEVADPAVPIAHGAQHNKRIQQGIDHGAHPTF